MGAAPRRSRSPPTVRPQSYDGSVPSSHPTVRPQSYDGTVSSTFWKESPRALDAFMQTPYGGGQQSGQSGQQYDSFDSNNTVDDTHGPRSLPIAAYNQAAVQPQNGMIGVGMAIEPMRSEVCCV
jgi:hypothetical protein